MAVYVDSIRPVRPTSKWPYLEACHLVADTMEELCEFAKKLNLKMSWLQQSNTSKLPHFDLVKGKRVQAVKLGAVEITDGELVRKIRAYRARPPCCGE